MYYTQGMYVSIVTSDHNDIFYCQYVYIDHLLFISVRQGIRLLAKILACMLVVQ